MDNDKKEINDDKKGRIDESINAMEKEVADSDVLEPLEGEGGTNGGELVLTEEFNGIINYLPISKKRIGEILVEQGKLTRSEVDRILNKQKDNKDFLFGETAVELRFTDQEAVDHALGLQFGYPVLPVGGSSINVNLVTLTNPSGRRSEEFRNLRSQLLFQWFDNERKTLVAIGTERHEGCSYTIANLAVVFAQIGKRVLLIDGDLRSPELHEVFNLPRSSGLSTVLSGRRNDCLPYQVSGLPLLSVLPAGPIPPNPQELIVQPAFKILLAIASDKFDIVLIDTPPAHIYSDAELISSYVEGALIVINQDKTRTAQLKELIERLEASKINVAGCVLNAH